MASCQVLDNQYKVDNYVSYQLNLISLALSFCATLTLHNLHTQITGNSCSIIEFHNFWVWTAKLKDFVTPPTNLLYYKELSTPDCLYNNLYLIPI